MIKQPNFLFDVIKYNNPRVEGPEGWWKLPMLCWEKEENKQEYNSMKNVNERTLLGDSPILKPWYNNSNTNRKLYVSRFNWCDKK